MNHPCAVRPSMGASYLYLTPCALFFERLFTSCGEKTFPKAPAPAKGIFRNLRFCLKEGKFIRFEIIFSLMDPFKAQIYDVFQKGKNWCNQTSFLRIVICKSSSQSGCHVTPERALGHASLS